MRGTFLFCTAAAMALHGAVAQTDCMLRSSTYSNHWPLTSAATSDSNAAKKPFPSLTQCYKFNTLACCVSGHDSHIKSTYEGLLSSTCVREFPELEYYMCLGCNDRQPEYMGNNTVYVCKKFAEKLFDKDPTIYDGCGLNLQPTLSDGSQASTSSFILPSRHYPNSTIFLNDVKPPYFEGYNIEVVEPTTHACLDSAGLRAVLSILSLVPLVATIMSWVM